MDAGPHAHHDTGMVHTFSAFQRYSGVTLASLVQKYRARHADGLEIVLKEPFKYGCMLISHHNRVHRNMVVYTEAHQEQFLALFRRLDPPLAHDIFGVYGRVSEFVAAFHLHNVQDQYSAFVIFA